MGHNFGMYLTGAEAVKAAQAFTDGHCYRSLYADGVKLAQVEIVLDDVVEVAYIASMENVEKAIKALAENGFSGVPYEVYTETVEGCYAQQTSTGRKGAIGDTTADTTDTTTAQPEGKKEEETMIETIKKELTERKDRSAWDKGVTVYALELLKELAEAIQGGYFDASDIAAPKLLARQLLNGAGDWDQYSWGGCSLVYDGDIAERLCNPTELKKTRNGERRPNSREEWLDMQARALRQAARRLQSAARNATQATA